MSRHSKRFFLVLRHAGGVIHEEEIDLNSLVHDVTFRAVCEGRLPNDGYWEPVELAPEWVDGRLNSMTVTVGKSSGLYSRAVFRERVCEIAATKNLFEGTTLDEKVDLTWDVEVRPAEPSVRGNRRRVVVRQQAYPLERRDRHEYPIDARAAAGTVSVSESLLEELREATANSLGQERADFLVGHLIHEPKRPPAVVLLNRIPADTETSGSIVRFSFSPRTFEVARRELELRGSGEVILGWHHNHPPPCGEKCLMTVPACQTDNVMFSFDDRVVHRSAFNRPFMVALVSGKGANRRADDPSMRAYGWRRGLICEKQWSLL